MVEHIGMRIQMPVDIFLRRALIILGKVKAITKIYGYS